MFVCVSCNSQLAIIIILLWLGMHQFYQIKFQENRKDNKAEKNRMVKGNVAPPKSFCCHSD